MSVQQETTFLLLDVGNTRVKWAWVSVAGGEVKIPQWLAEGACPHSQLHDLFREWASLPAPDQIFGTNVAGKQAVVLIENYWRQRGVSLAWVKATAACCGVSNTYEHPEQLGADRWVALVGAWSETYGACLVVSAGTALTIDMLDAQGVFQGGMILPGKKLMQASLAAGTHALAAMPGGVTLYPRNTADAMASGIAAALANPVCEAYMHLATQTASPPACLLSGGDAEWLSSQLKNRCNIPSGRLQRAPRLMMQGLLHMALEKT